MIYEDGIQEEGKDSGLIAFVIDTLAATFIWRLRPIRLLQTPSNS